MFARFAWMLIFITHSSSNSNSGSSSDNCSNSYSFSSSSGCAIYISLMIKFGYFWLTNLYIRWYFILADELGKIDKVGWKDIMLSFLSLWNFCEFLLNIDGKMRKSWQEYVGFLILEESNILFILMKWKIIVITDFVHFLDEVECEGLAKLFLLHLLKLVSNLTLLLEK